MKRMRVIFNPMAAGGRGARLEPDVRACLTPAAHNANVELDWVETQEPGHATVLASQAVANGCDMVVAVGGDGTVNEVINGLMQAEDRRRTVTLGIIPLGSGNDFAWSVGIALDPVIACRRLFDGQTRVIDLGQTREDGGRQRYFCNGSGTGFDAQTALEVERFKWLRGIFVYLVPLFKTLIFHHRVPELRISVDGQEWTQRSMMLTVCNGRRLGRGFLITPEAELDDGLLDVCICGELGRLGILMVIPRFMRGTHVTHSEVQMKRARRVSVESSVPLVVHQEGENFSTDARALEFSVVPGALRLRV
jgi:YegS/Rv2252/BmrU family lipid kinase